MAKAYVRGSQQALRTQAALESLLGYQVMKVRVLCVCVRACVQMGFGFGAGVCSCSLGSKCSILICR